MAWNPLNLFRSLRSPAPAVIPASRSARATGHRPRMRGGAIPIASGYAGAAVDRLTSGLATWSAGPNASLEGSLVILRARGRQLAADAGYGKRFCGLVATHVVGPDGPRLQVRAYNAGNRELDTSANAAIEAAFAEWSTDCDITGHQSLPEMLQLLASATARDGEALVRIIKRRDLTHGIALQLLEVDRLDETINGRTPGGNVIRMGVELDSMSRPVAYHVRQAHPGDPFIADRPTIERVPASEMIHLFLKNRAEQVRGASWFHAVIRDLAMLEGYEEAAVIAARVGASKMGFFQRAVDEDATPTGAAASSVADGDTTGSVGGVLSMSAEPGELYELPAGYTFDTFNPDYPHGNFADFTKAILRSISAGLDVDYATLANDLESVNYSSMRAGSIETRDTWKKLQGWFIHRVMIRLYREWLASALLRGDIVLDRGTPLPADRLAKFIKAARFQGRRWSWVDPLKDAQASAELINARLASRTEIAASQGRDFDDVVAELKAEQEQIDAAGLTPPAPRAPAPPTPPQDEDDEEDIAK